MMIKAIIMAGGYGARFWPKSRKNIPKQILEINSNKPMIVDTVERLKPLVKYEDLYVSTSKDMGKHIKGILPKEVNYVLEPMGKGTAAAIGLSAITMLDKDPEAVMFIETADHVYNDVDAYLTHIREAVEVAREGSIVLIGIKPTHPHTGLGYIKHGTTVKEDGIRIYNVLSFKEKPDLETAKKFLHEGTYLWNSGMFIAKASAMLDEIQKYMPRVHEGLMKIKASKFDENVIKEEFKKFPSLSIDYGVMEKSLNTVVLEGNFHWDDIGDWQAMDRLFGKDENGNVVKASYEGNAKNSIIFSDRRKIKAVDVEDLIIVDTEDCLLVCAKDRAQDVRKVVDMLEQDKELTQYCEDMVKNYATNVIEIEGSDCEVRGKGIIASVGVSGILINRGKDDVLIEAKK